MKKLALLLSLTACVDLDSEDNLAEVEQESHSTTAATLPNKIVLARLDDSATSAVLQWSGNRLFANKADHAGTPLLHHYFPNNVVQLVVGDFSVEGAREHGRDQVCARFVDNKLYCYAPSDDKSELWYWFAQTWPLTSAETPIIGDFTGDGAADILAFNSSTGGLRLFDRTTTGVFTERTFSLGNLASYDLRGKKLYAGEFGQAMGRSDLIVVDPVNNTVTRFDSVTSGSYTTFWYAFQSRPNTLAANEQITVANLEGGTSRDGLLLRNPATGALRAMRVEYGSGYLVPVPSSTLSLGQLPVTTHAGTFAAVRLVDHSAEPNGKQRDDILFFDNIDGKIIETSARHDGTRMTYWWGWTKDIPAVPTWSVPDSKMAIVFCKTKDHAGYEPDKNEALKRVIGVGTGSIRDYLLEVTFGAIDIKNADVFGWVQGTLNAADSNARVPKVKPPLPEGLKLDDYLDDCLKAAKVDRDDYDGRVYVILNASNVSSQGSSNGATMEYPEIVTRNRLYFAAHELLHAFGLGHADDDSSCEGEYCDTSSVMGNYYPTLFTNAQGYEMPPGMNAVNLDKLGVVPASRIVNLAAPTTSQTRTITLAALESPEANGALYVRVNTGTSKYFTIALRRQVGYDRKVPTGVQIHESDAGRRGSTLQTNPRRTLLPGDTGVAGGFFVTVNAIDSAKKTATITLVH